MAAKKQSSSSRLDFVTVGGIVVAMGGILGGLILEGGRLQDVSQFTAALVVLGGTLGALMISTPMDLLKGSLGRLTHVLIDKTQPPQVAIEELIAFASKARKNGLVSLETEVLEIPDPFLRKALTFAVDGTDLQELRSMMQLEIELSCERAMAEARVFESAGGYSPTIGIIGAVMGLIQVMKNLANIDEVGRGIAVAFVATVYGVGLANIILLPAANKIKCRIENERNLNELKLEGVCAIVEGMNPKLIRSKLDAYLRPNAVSEKEAKTKPGSAREPLTAKS